MGSGGSIGIYTLFEHRIVGFPIYDRQRSATAQNPTLHYIYRRNNTREPIAPRSRTDSPGHLLDVLRVAELRAQAIVVLAVSRIFEIQYSIEAARRHIALDANSA